MKYVFVLIACLMYIHVAAQEDQDLETAFIFSPLKMGFGTRFGQFKSWNSQLDQYGYSTIDMNNEESFEFSLYLKNHITIKYLVSIGNKEDSVYINNRFMEYKRRFKSLSLGYDFFSLDKIGAYVLVPSVGVYTGRDRLLLKARVPNSNYDYRVQTNYLYRFESGLNPNLHISINPFSRNKGLTFAGLGIDVGAFCNFNWHHKSQYKYSLDGNIIPHDKPVTPYLKLSMEPFRGAFGYQRVKKKEKIKSILSI